MNNIDLPRKASQSFCHSVSGSEAGGAVVGMEAVAASFHLKTSPINLSSLLSYLTPNAVCQKSRDVASGCSEDLCMIALWISVSCLKDTCSNFVLPPFTVTLFSLWNGGEGISCCVIF